jgi:hypothetical protein
LGFGRFALVLDRCELRDNYISYFWNSELFKDMETTKKHLKFGLGEYDKPTPKKLRRLGDGLLLASSLITNELILTSPAVASISLIVGTIGKFLTNFFSEG